METRVRDALLLPVSMLSCDINMQQTSKYLQAASAWNSMKATEELISVIDNLNRAQLWSQEPRDHAIGHTWYTTTANLSPSLIPPMCNHTLISCFTVSVSHVLSPCHSGLLTLSALVHAKLPRRIVSLLSVFVCLWPTIDVLTLQTLLTGNIIIVPSAKKSLHSNRDTLRFYEQQHSLVSEPAAVG